MSSFLNRLKNLKTGSINFNNHEGDTGSISSFDEEGFLCPVCHRKFTETGRLEQHYLQAHAESAGTYPDTNGTKNSIKHEETEDSHQETAIWKQQFVVSEESRMQLSSELMQQRQRVGDLEEELEFLQKQLRTTQMKVIEQSQAIGNLKASKDIHDAQLAMFTDELLNTQGELKEKQNQVDTLYNDLIPSPTNDDVDVLKRELISVQQRMNDLSLEKEQQIEPLRDGLLEIYAYTQRLDQFEDTFNQNITIYDEIINTQTSQIESDLHQIKQFLHLTRERKEKLIDVFRDQQTSLNENQIEIDGLKQLNSQLDIDLEHRTERNNQLTNDFQSEQTQSNSYRIEIEKLTSELAEIEQSFEALKQEKNQLFLNKMDGDENDERQNLVRQLTQEKDQYEQQNKDLRKQIKQMNEEKSHIQQELENLSQQFTQIENEKNQLQNEQSKFQDESHSLKQQLDERNQDKERQANELSSIQEEYNSINSRLETDLRQANENHKQENERLEKEFQEIRLQLTEQINQLEKENSELKKSLHEQEELVTQTKLQLDTTQNDKNDLEKQVQTQQQTIEEFQTTISQLHTDLDHKNNSINRLSTAIRRSIDLAHKTYTYIQDKIDTSQSNLLSIIEQSEQEFQTIRIQTFEEIRNEFTNYLTVIHTVIIDHKNKLDKQIEEDNSKLLEEQVNAEKQLNKLKNEHNQLIEEYKAQKEKLEIQLGEVNHNLSQVSETLSQSTQTANDQREKLEKQIVLLEDELTTTRSDLESRIKKYEMQLSALTENLSTVRSELKLAHEKLIDFEQLKSEKVDLEARLVVIQDERQVCLERSITSENRNEKLLLENGQLAKKNSDLEYALQEIAREYQGLQIQTNRASERRWVNDHDIHDCMKCHQTFTLTQRKHHCRCCGNVFCDTCSSKTAIIAAASKKPQRVCDQCFKELTS